MVTAEQLRKLYYAEPFEPFVIRHKDGKRTQVVDRYTLLIAPVPRQLLYHHGKETVQASFDDITIEPANRGRVAPRRKRAS